MPDVRAIDPKAIIVCKENGRPLELTRLQALHAIKEGRIRLLSNMLIDPVLTKDNLWKQLPKETRNAIIVDWALVNTFLMQTKDGQRFSDIHSDYQDNVSVYIPEQFRKDKNTNLIIDLNKDNFTFESYKGDRILLHFDETGILQLARPENDEWAKANESSRMIPTYYPPVGGGGQERYYLVPNSDLARLLARGGYSYLVIYGNRSVNAFGNSGDRFWTLEENSTF
jgi:hypothetical protein